MRYTDNSRNYILPYLFRVCLEKILGKSNTQRTYCRQDNGESAYKIFKEIVWKDDRRRRNCDFKWSKVFFSFSFNEVDKYGY